MAPLLAHVPYGMHVMIIVWVAEASSFHKKGQGRILLYAALVVAGLPVVLLVLPSAGVK